MHLLDLQSSALQPDPKPGPRKSLCAKSLCGDTKLSGGTKLSGHRGGGPGLRLQHQASLCLSALPPLGLAAPRGWLDVPGRVSRSGTST